MKKYAVLLALLVNPAFAASTEAPLGNSLVVSCESDEISCLTYLLGVHDGLVAAGLMTSQRLICPGRVNAAQLRLVFNKWARENPAELSRTQGLTAVAALVSAFPCSEK